jgi:transcriptional regulator with XRE-family HTH domain
MEEHQTNHISVEGLVGANVRELRQQRGWKQEDLARELARYDSIHQRFQVKDIELGKRNVTASELFALAHVFDVPLWRFYVPGEKNVDDTILMGEVEISACEYLIRIIGAMDHNSVDINYVPSQYAFDLLAALRYQRQDSPCAARLWEAIIQVAGGEGMSPFRGEFAAGG